MKYVFLGLAIILFGTKMMAQEENPVLIAQQLIKDSFEDIWSNFDTAAIGRYHTKDFIILEAGEVWDNARIVNYQLESLGQTSSLVRNNRFEFIRGEHYGDFVWLAYHNFANWTTYGKPAGKAQWLESAVAVKTDNGWRLQMMHSTPIQVEE